MRIYLSGPLDGQTNEQIQGWREQVKSALLPLGYTFTNNDLRIWDRCNSQESCAYIVESDLHEIDLCDILLIHTNKPVVGTAMECLYASERNKIVISVLYDGYDHSWLRYYSSVCFNDLNEAIRLLQFAAKHQLDKIGLKKLIQEQL